MKSSTLPIYKTWLASSPPVPQIDFVDSVYALCEKNYSNGGDVVVESFEPSEILDNFDSLPEVQAYCGFRASRALDCRQGTDSDPELETYRRFSEEWED